MLAGAILLAVFYFGAGQFRTVLSDSIFQFDFALVNIITGIGLLSLLAGCLVWLLLFSNWSFGLSRLLPLVVVLASVTFLVMFRPVFTGTMGISRWEPRYWNWRVLAAVDGELKTDMNTELASDFSQFLGSNRNGIIDNFSVRLNDFYRVEQLYKQDVGQAWSGFVARNGYAITMEQRGRYECVICYEIETGAVAWSYRHARRHDDSLGGVGPRATPTLSGNRVYAQGANGLLVCLDAGTGKLVWKQDLCELLNIELIAGIDKLGNELQTEETVVVWGRAGSPLVVDDLVVVPAGGPLDGDQVSLIAFNKVDGTEAWRGGNKGPGYSSPNVYELAGQSQIVIVNESCVSGHEPKTGNVLWIYDHPGTSNADANTSQAVLVGDNRLLLSRGYGLGGELIEVSKTGDGDFQVKSIWKNSRVLKTKLTSAIVSGNFAFSISDGILECVNVKTGERVWKKGRFGHGQMLLVDDQLLIHSEHGVLHLVEASTKSFQPVSEIETISGVCWNTICAFDRYILVRSDLEMACFKVGHEE